MPLVEHEPDRLRAVEFVPFRAAIAAGVASLMSCHVLVPAFDETRPGTLSPAIVQGLMRDELGFDGLIFTDDMEMKAIAARMPVPDACVAAVAAGCDAVLVCSGNHDLQAATIEALIRAVENGELSYARVEQALARQRRAKERFLVPATEALGPDWAAAGDRGASGRGRPDGALRMSGALARPPALRHGDVVALVAPASPFDAEEFDAGVAELTTLGFNPEWHHDLFARLRYVAGPAATRAGDFLRAWQDPRVSALFAVRGGYGSAQIVLSLDPGTIRATPKALVGYSDLTTLLTWLVGHCGVVAFHGPTVAGRLGRGPDAYNRASLLAALTVAAPMGELTLEGAETFVAGEARGPVARRHADTTGRRHGHALRFDTVGRHDPVARGCRRAAVSPRPPRPAGARRGPVCDECAACCWARFPGATSPAASLTAREVLADLFADFPGPVVFGVRTGHVDGPALTLPLGVQARLVAGTVPRLVVEEAAVS